MTALSSLYSSSMIYSFNSSNSSGVNILLFSFLTLSPSSFNFSSISSILVLVVPILETISSISFSNTVISFAIISVFSLSSSLILPLSKSLFFCISSCFISKLVFNCNLLLSNSSFWSFNALYFPFKPLI